MKSFGTNPLAAAAIYAFFGAMWIVTSDTLTEWVYPVGDQNVAVQTIKGILFILATSILVYVLVRRTKESLTQRDSHYRELFSRSPDAQLMVSLTGRIVDANGAAGVLYGYPEDALVGRPFEELASTASLEGVVSAALHPESNRLSGRHQKADGTLFDAECLARGVVLEGERFALCSIRDVSEAVESERALQESEQSLQWVLLGAELGTWDWNVKSGHVTFNERWAEMLGYSLEEIENHVDVWKEKIHPDDYEDVEGQLEAHLQGVSPGFEVEHRLRHTSGEWVWVLDKGKVIQRDAEGNALRMCGTNLDISRRKHAELALNQAQSCLELAVTSAMVGIWDWDFASNTVEYSREWKSQLGYEEHEIGTHFDEWESRVHPEDLPNVMEVVRRYVADPLQGYNAEFRMRHRDGSYRWIFAQGALKHDGDGVPNRMLGSHIDITQVKQSEERLRNLLRRDEALTSALEEIVYEWRPDEDHLTWSGDYSRILGYSAEEMGSDTKSWTERIHPKDRERALRGVQQAAAERTLYDMEYRFLKKDGSYCWMQDRGVPYLDSDGNLERMIGVFRDVTVRKQAEEELWESQLLLVAALEASNMGTWSWDLRTGSVHWDHASMALFGVTPEEAERGDYETFARKIHPEDRERVEARLQESIRVLKPFEAEYRVVLDNGDERWLADRGTPRHEDGTPIQMVGACVDITSRIRLEEERQALEAQLRQAQKMEAVGLLAGGVAHDFNNVLQSIQGYGQLLLERVSDDAECRDFVNNIMSGAERAGNLTRQLLAFSSQQVIQPRNVDINRAISELVQMIGRTIGEHITTSFKPDDNAGGVYADPGQIEQVVMNLCVNARDAMPEGGHLIIETGRVTADQEFCDLHPPLAPGDHVTLTVSDTGSGMDEATRLRIFEPFFTTKGQGKGTGLGLATVYGIVHQHQGSINVYSELDKGTTFKVYLPRVEIGRASAAPQQTARMQGGTETILFAEDDSMLRTLGIRILEGAGYTVLAAEDGAMAMEIGSEHIESIDMALLDVVMPKAGGKEVHDALKAMRPQLPVLFSSGYGASIVESNYALTEGFSLIEKPYTISSLLTKVRDVLDHG